MIRICPAGSDTHSDTHSGGFRDAAVLRSSSTVAVSICVTFRRGETSACTHLQQPACAPTTRNMQSGCELFTALHWRAMRRSITHTMHQRHGSSDVMQSLLYVHNIQDVALFMDTMLTPSRALPSVTIEKFDSRLVYWDSST